MTSLTLIGSVLAAVMLLGGWMLAQTRDQHGLPRRGLVSLGEAMASLGLLLGVLAVPLTLPPQTYAVALALVLLVGLLMVRGAGRLAIGWTSAAEIGTSAVALGWTRPRRAVVSLLALCGGLTLAVWLAARGEPAAGLLGAAVALAPARWWLPWGAARERARTGIERALAGLLQGGLEWETHEASQRGAPVRVRFAGDATPTRVSYPLPPTWRSSAEENLEEDLRARLSRWGYWLTHVDHSSRYAVAEAVERLPDMIEYAGSTATDRGEVVLGRSRLSRQAARALGRQYGEVVPFVWDARIAPHGEIVGTTGGGKSSTFRVAITSWCRNLAKRVILLDPKAVEFELFRGRRGVMAVAQTVEEMTEALRMVNAEYERRVQLCKRYGVTAVWNLPKDVQPPSWLFVIDEIMDYLDKSPANTDEAKAENELRAQAIDILNRLFMKARVMDIHGLLAGQRLDKNVLSGRIQNNAPLRILTSVTEAGSSERHMIGLQEVEPSEAVPGRGVAKSVRLPESEVQLTYLDEADLDEWLPMDDAASREWSALMSGEIQSGNGGDDQPRTEEKPEPSSGKRPRRDRDDAKPKIEQKPEPGPGNDRGTNDDKPGPVTEGDPDPADDVDPLDFFGDDD